MAANSPRDPGDAPPGTVGTSFQDNLGDALDFLSGDEPPPALPAGHTVKSSFAAKPSSPLDASLCGDGRSILVLEILGLLSNLSKSGLLWVTTARERFLLQLENGRIVYAQSDRPPAGSRLGEILLARGALTSDDLAHGIEGARASGQPLGAWLLGANRISSSDLHAALAEQVQGIFNRMFAAPDSTYQFEDGKRLARSEDVRLNVVQLLLESARASDESVQLPFPIGPATA